LGAEETNEKDNYRGVDRHMFERGLRAIHRSLACHLQRRSQWIRWGFAVATDKRGNTYITGQTTNPGTATDYITIKYSPTGTQLWKQYYKGGDPNSDGVDIAHAIAVDNDGNVYVTGESQIGPSNPYSYYGFATVKYDTNGVQKWCIASTTPQPTAEPSTSRSTLPA
jgi:hypothetical protein